MRFPIKVDYPPGHGGEPMPHILHFDQTSDLQQIAFYETRREPDK